MQAQTGSDTASSTPDIPSSTWLKFAIATGIFWLISGLIGGGYTFYVEVLHPHYYWTNHFNAYAPLTSVKIDRGIDWFIWVPLIVMGFITALASWCVKLEYYHDVQEGKIVKQYESTNVLGGRYYFFVIEGKNKAGEIRQQSHEVGQKVYFTNDVGDEISVKKE